MSALLLGLAALWLGESTFVTDHDWTETKAEELSEAKIDAAIEQASKDRLVPALNTLAMVVEATIKEKQWKSKYDGDEDEFRPELLWQNRVEREEKWINPITAVCWKCMFPMHLAGARLPGPAEHDPDSMEYKIKPVCWCGLTNVGVPFAFWEPAMVLEVTPTPYRFPFLGGKCVETKSYANRGTISNGDSGRTGFYNVHQFPFPLFRILGLLPGLSCMKTLDPIHKSFWLTEWDPLWNNPTWAAALSPNMLFHSNHKAALECIEDCQSSTHREPRNELHWCAGCLGSYYPLVGHVAHHIGHIQASSLLVHRTLARLHALGLMKGFEPNNYCKKKRFFKLQKSFYKTQLIYPVPDLGTRLDPEDPKSTVYCHSLGASDSSWVQDKSFPDGGEDFVYLIWTKMHCCLGPKDRLHVEEAQENVAVGEVAAPKIEPIGKIEEIAREIEENPYEMAAFQAKGMKLDKEPICSQK